MAKTIDIELDKIRIDGGTQPRAKIDMEVVNDYSTSLELGANFPPIDVFFDGKEYWLADGFHRYHAARDVHVPELPATIHNGTVRDAILFSLGCNDRHGLRRTNEDKRHSVMTMLNDPEWSQWSDRTIADKCGVSNTFVGHLRSEKVSTVDTFSKPVEVKYTTSTGKTATMPVQPSKQKQQSAPAVATETSKPTKHEPEHEREQEVEHAAPAKTWEVFDDITRLRQLIAKLHDNWVTESDRKIIAQFFRQCANEV